jgi:hypothetical protein
MTMTSPGWYADGHGAMRWWDGSTWTEHVASPEDGETPALAAAAAEPRASDAQPNVEPDPPKSRLWIVWLVLGVTVLGIVAALAVLLSVLVAARSTQDSEPVSEADEEAAVDAVNAYAESLLTGDCDVFLATTTEDYRTVLEIPDCDTFELASTRAVDRMDDHVLTIGDVATVGPAVTVSVVESFTSSFDRAGNPTDAPIDYEDHLAYYLVRSDGGWAIERFRTEDPPDDAADASGETPAEQPAVPQPSADEQAAEDAVGRYTEAWLTGDCDGYFETTTDAFQELGEITDCETFVASSHGYTGSMSNYVSAITDVETLGTEIAVSAIEFYTSYYDDEGNPTDQPVDHEDRFEYYLVPSAGGWEIDDVFAE